MKKCTKKKKKKYEIFTLAFQSSTCEVFTLVYSIGTTSSQKFNNIIIYTDAVTVAHTVGAPSSY